jgi:hypothetical protein
MPYNKFRRWNKYCIRNLKTGKVTCFQSQQDRDKGIRIREAFAHGFKPTRKSTMMHRHSGPLVRYRTRRNNIKYRKRPMHIQTLIFPKDKYTRNQALVWAKKHGYKHYTSRIQGNEIRIRQFPPKQVKRYGGRFKLGDDVEALYTPELKVKKRSLFRDDDEYSEEEDIVEQKIKDAGTDAPLYDTGEVREWTEKAKKDYEEGKDHTKESRWKGWGEEL